MSTRILLLALATCLFGSAHAEVNVKPTITTDSTAKSSNVGDPAKPVRRKKLPERAGWNGVAFARRASR